MDSVTQVKAPEGMIRRQVEKIKSLRLLEAERRKESGVLSMRYFDAREQLRTAERKLVDMVVQSFGD